MRLACNRIKMIFKSINIELNVNKLFLNFVILLLNLVTNQHIKPLFPIKKKSSCWLN